MNSYKKHAHTVVSDAAEWLHRMDETSSTSHEEFVEWLSKDKEHVREFLEMIAIHVELGWIEAEEWREIQRIRARSDTNVIALPDSPEPRGVSMSGPAAIPENRHGSHRNRKWLLGLVAGLICIALGIEFVVHDFANTYTTATGESRILMLKDGSSVHMNTQSRLRVRYFGDRRDVELLQGEAIFQVAHEPSRPFRVLHGDIVFQALGTKFDVHLSDDRITLLVLEGRVGISSSDRRSAGADRTTVQLRNGERYSGTQRIRTVLHAGQQAELRRMPRGAVMQVAPVNPLERQRRVAWITGRLVFEGETLIEAAAEFNRYNRRRLIIADPSVGRMQLSGTFPVQELNDFVGSLEQPFNVIPIVSTPDVIVLDAAPARSHHTQ